MSSGKEAAKEATYERTMKLFMSACAMVVDGKRTLEAFCLVLQEFVFGRHEISRFKNWPAILDIGRDNNHLMMALAELDLVPKKTGDWLEDRMIAAFPQCFSSAEVVSDETRQMPFSILKREATKLPGNTGLCPEFYLEGNGILARFRIPFVVIALCTDEVSGPNVVHLSDEQLQAMGIPLSGDIPSKHYFGKKVVFRGEEHIVVDICDWNRVCLSSVKYIDPAK